jgi:hypothetical protein
VTFDFPVDGLWIEHQTPNLVLDQSGCLPCLIIRLIMTIRRHPSGSVWIDEAPNVSRPDPSGADQIDAEHQATELAVVLAVAGGPQARPDHACVVTTGAVMGCELSGV